MLIEINGLDDKGSRSRQRLKCTGVVRVFLHHAALALVFPPLLSPRFLFCLLSCVRFILAFFFFLLLIVIVVVVLGRGSPLSSGAVPFVFHVETDEPTPKRSGRVLDVDNRRREMLDPGR